MLRDVLCAGEKGIWISPNIQRGTHPRNDIGNPWSPTLRYSFPLLVPSLTGVGNDEEYDCGNDEEVWTGEWCLKLETERHGYLIRPSVTVDVVCTAFYETREPVYIIGQRLLGSRHRHLNVNRQADFWRRCRPQITTEP